MSWVRLDDQFPTHPKVAQLTDRQFRVHVRVLCYCSKFSKDGVISPAFFSEVRGLTEKVGQRFLELGIWDEREDGSRHVHDFKKYGPKDPTGADRQSRFRNARSNAESNGVGNSLSNDVRNVLSGTGKALEKNTVDSSESFDATRAEVLGRGGETT